MSHNDKDYLLHCLFHVLDKSFLYEHILYPQNSPNNMSGMSNPPGTPRDEDVGGSYLHSFQNENVSII